MYPDRPWLMHSLWSVWDFPARRPRGLPDDVGARRYYFRMRPVRAREGDRPLVPTLTADPGMPTASNGAASNGAASKEAAKAASAKTAPGSASAADGYTARHLSVLEGLEAVR